MRFVKYLSLFFLCTLVLTSIVIAQAQSTDSAPLPFSLYLPLINSEDAAVTDETFVEVAGMIEVAVDGEADAVADEEILSAALTTITLRPASYTTTSGSSGGQPVTNLHVQDQSGTQNDWNKYVEWLTPGTQKYIGYRTYTLPATINPATITALQLQANYLGPVKSYQTWTWTIYNWSTRTWVRIGDNAGAPSWQWKSFAWNLSGTLRDYVNSSNRQIRVRLQSNNVNDNMDLDYEALRVTYENGVTGTATPTPTRTPTPTNTPMPATWWKPTPGTSWQIQLIGAVDTSFNAQVYFIDLFDVDQSTISQLKQQGRKVVCYFSAGSWEPWRPDASAFPEAVKGNQLVGWNEKWLDIRNLTVLGPIMAARMDLAVSKGCNGIDPDNVDGYETDNNSGFPLTPQDQLAYNRWIAQQAHMRGLAVGLKNDLEQIPQLINYFDWALNEECFEENECEKLVPFINANKPVFGIEYNSNEAAFCPRANNWNFDFHKKEWDLTAWRLDCRILGTTPTATPTSTPQPSQPLAILLPLYNYPSWYDAASYLWDDVAAANSRAPITAIINPYNGPNGGPPNSDYVRGLNDLRTAGVTLIGYVSTNYGNRDINLVKADIDLYAAHFGLNGIFLDESATGTDKLSYYATLYSYIKSKSGLTRVVLNPGTNTAESYLTQPAGDTAVIFENGSGWPGYVPDAYVRNYPANRFAMLAYNVVDATTMRSYVDLAKARNIGYVYITNDGGDNPWDTLPSYWTALVDYVAQP
jgi:hypothetical protein